MARVSIGVDQFFIVFLGWKTPTGFFFAKFIAVVRIPIGALGVRDTMTALAFLVAVRTYYATDEPKRSAVLGARTWEPKFARGSVRWRFGGRRGRCR